MLVKFFGVRGSYPVPGHDTELFGGNTTCVTFEKEYNGKINRVIIDSGTGIIPLGKQIIKNFFDKKEELELNICFSHLHPDHTQGFPFFAPNFFKNCKIKLYGMQTLQKHIGDILTEMMYPPIFPIEYRELKSQRDHIVVTEGSSISINNCLSVECMQAFAPSHPQQGAIYYKVRDILDGTTAVCIWDNESKVGGDKAVVRFSKDADMMIHDTQYTAEEYTSDKMIVQGFGHSSYDMAIENAKQANVKKLVCIHYNPAHTDSMLTKIKDNYPAKAHPIEFVMANEGMELLV
jgi:ribonuclease BN (tRNA processing enzyme)